MITARVIRIISKKQLIINAGSQDGVKRGMKFTIYSPEEVISDPETGEELGVYRAKKVTVEPDIIQERFTLASQPYESGLALFEDDVGADAHWPDLPVDPSQITPITVLGNVQVGDTAEEVVAPSTPEPVSAAEDDIPF
jgi:hypothetical protein